MGACVQREEAQKAGAAQTSGLVAKKPRFLLPPSSLPKSHLASDVMCASHDMKEGKQYV